MTYEQAHRSIKRGQLDGLRKAIPTELSASSSNRYGWSLLMLTAIEGNVKIGAFLIDQGADVAALNDFGESALSLAAHKGHLPFVQLLKSHGAPANARPHGHSLEDWLRIASGLPKTKIEAILAIA